jgi:predicted nucleic acid-binding Zn ribbon protein
MQYCYKCNKCLHEQEVQHKLNEENKDPCDKCGAEPKLMTRIMSLTAGRHGSWGKWKGQQ